MCGVIGNISKGKKVSDEIKKGLIHLQHRGYETAGILTSSEQIHLVKGLGNVDSVLSGKNLEELVGDIGIGHVRYTTTAKAGDAQPFFSDYGSIGLAHNGHIINRKEIRKCLKEKGIYFDSVDCDAEEILRLFSYFYFNQGETFCERIENSLRKTMETLIGSYSVVAVIHDKGLLGFKDPLGIRPLSYGERLKDSKIVSCAFASESIALKKLGYGNIREVEPGTFIFIDKDLNKHEKGVLRRGKKTCMFEYVYFSRATSKIDGVSVNGVRYNLGEELAILFKQKYPDLSKDETIVMPVPETAYPAAISFSKNTGFDFKLGFEKTRAVGRLFLRPNQQERESSTEINLETFDEIINGKRVVVIDDSIVRGTTSKKIVEMIKTAGAKEVYFCSSCPRIPYSCFYGIDTPTQKELVAFDKTDEEISKIIGAPVLYNTIDGLVRAIGKPKQEICLACLNGDYPTAI